MATSEIPGLSEGHSDASNTPPLVKLGCVGNSHSFLYSELFTGVDVHAVVEQLENIVDVNYECSCPTDWSTSCSSRALIEFLLTAWHKGRRL